VTLLSILKVLASASVGVLSFHALHLPMPWLLGPIFAVMLAQLTIRTHWEWPGWLRNCGLVLLGAAVGEAFTRAAFSNIGNYILYMLLLNIVLLLFCVLLAYVTQKLTGLSFITALTASIPGGLSQSVTFAEEHKGIELGAVTYFQVIRVLSIVSIVPFIVSGQLIPEAGEQAGAPLWQLVLYVLLAFASVPIGRKLKLPVAHFLTPVLVGIIINAIGVQPPVIPDMLLHVAQLAIGAYIGLLLKPDMIKLPWKVATMGLLSALILLLFSYGCSIVLAKLMHVDMITSFLSTAAGGMDQMSLIAAAMKADAAFVTLFQLFRLLFIYFIVFPLLQWTASKVMKSSSNSSG